jgi:cell division protein FtsX
MLVAFVGAWIKGFKGTLISLVGLAGATLSYVLWWPLYFRLVAISHPVELQFIRHMVYLYQANYLDILVAALIGLLIAWHVRSALVSLFRPTKPCS